MIVCSDGEKIDNGTGRDERTALDSVRVRACLEGPILARAHACADVSPGELWQIFGEQRINYARRLVRAGKRLRHPLVVAALVDAGLRPVLAASRHMTPDAQLAAASLCVSTPRKASVRRPPRDLPPRDDEHAAE